MKFIDAREIPRYLNVRRNLIDWNKKSRSKFQTNVKKFLKTYWEKHIVYEELPVIGTKMSVDFFNFTRGIILEVQGGQHIKPNIHFHGKAHTGYVDQIKRDILKMEFAERNNFTFIEIYPKDLEKLSEEFFFKKFGIYLI